MNALHYVMSHIKAARIVRDERGVTALEYAMIAALIGLAIIAILTTLGGTLNTIFTTVNTKMAVLTK